MYDIDEKQLRLWWQVFKSNKELVEVRLLGKNAYSGYFTNIETLITQLKPLLDSSNVRYYGNLQAYFTLNVINEALYSREQRDVFVKKPKSTTTDGDIVRRKFVMIDLDPNRAAGISASDSEFEKAHLKCVVIYKYLIQQGFNEPIITKSGNGWHCYLPCDMPNDDAHTELIKRFLQSISKMFSDANVEVDEKVFNAARIDKLIGTWAKKGSDGDDRKWRIASFAKIPQDLSPNDDALFQKIADLLPKEEPKQIQPNRVYNTSQPFDLVSWMNQHGIKYREKKNGNSTLYELETCPWIEQHSDRKKWDSALFQDAQGKVTFNCTHSHCKNKTWHDVRLFYEPNAYDKPQYIPQQQYTRYQPPKPRYEIKGEIPELGKKWLTMSSIKKLDLSSINGIKTGFELLDKAINKLHFGEVTLLSGSNACVDCDTEYFNGTQWKKISEFSLGEKVLQYNLDGSANLVIPQRYIKTPCDELYLIQSITGVDQCVSGNHNLIYMTSKGNLAKKSVNDMLIQHENSNKGFTGKFYTTFRYDEGCGIDLSDIEIRLMCAIICDGSFSCRFKDKNIVRINIKKQRKKERLEMLLQQSGISYRKEQYHPKDLQYNTYLFHAPRREKEFLDYWYNCNAKQLAVVADEILYWDGTINYEKRKSSSYSSTSKRNIDFIQFAFASIGVRTHICIDDRIGKYHSNGKYIYKSICYQLTICKTKNPSIINPNKKKKILKVKPKDGYKYCFTVPSGMLVLRRNGNINITGNSGKSSWLNTLLMNIANQNTPVALWSGELPEPILKTWLQMVAAGRNNLRLSSYGDGKYYVPNNIGELIDNWLDDKLLIYNTEYGNQWEQLFSDMTDLANAGFKVFVLDNLMAMNIDLLSGDKNEKQRQVILDLKKFAKTKDVHLILVAHPRKSMAFLRKTDISGTSDLTNAVDNCFIMHRVNQDFFRAGGDFYGERKIQMYADFGNVLEVCKNRMYGVVDLLIGLHYETESRRFKNTADEQVRYGWEQTYTQSYMSYDDDVKLDPLGDPWRSEEKSIAPF